MKLKTLIPGFFVLLILLFSCENRTVEIQTTISSDELSFVSEEVIADLEFADLLDEGDDGGIFWGDNDFVTLKSAEIGERTCPQRTVVWEDNKKIVTLDFSGDECGNSGTIIIEYFKQNDGESVKKKTITYIDFTKRGVTFNGEKKVEKTEDNFNIKAELEVDKLNDDNQAVHLRRSYHRQVHWLCGLDTRDVKEDNIKTVSGSSEVAKSINGGEELLYSRQILSPLLIVKACELKIQAGSVKIKKADGTKITIDYGAINQDIACDSEFDCGTTFDVAIDGETFSMEYTDGKRVRQVASE